MTGQRAANWTAAVLSGLTLAGILYVGWQIRDQDRQPRVVLHVTFTHEGKEYKVDLPRDRKDTREDTMRQLKLEIEAIEKAVKHD